MREICGKEDIDIAYKHFKAFYQTFSSIDRKLKVDGPDGGLKATVRRTRRKREDQEKQKSSIEVIEID